jgi:membrane peptidoglycan carboxypeptidase
VLSASEDALLTQLLAGVVSHGTGTAAAIPGRAVAGKTGTTENYGDAWFVGWTPGLVTAVWVGYPDGLRPMLHEFHGGPVVGGSFPAEIWKTFTQSAVDALGLPAESFPPAPYVPGVAKRVTYRDGRIELDNGSCQDTSLLVYFEGRGPAKTANCGLHEVDVPNVVGLTLAAARSRLAAQPLTPQLIYAPAPAGRTPGTVLRQFPASGTLSTFGTVRLVVASARRSGG